MPRKTDVVRANHLLGMASSCVRRLVSLARWGANWSVTSRRMIREKSSRGESVFTMTGKDLGERRTGSREATFGVSKKA